MEKFDAKLLKNLYMPLASSHKGQNGKLLLIGGSTLFHAAPLWALTVASRIVDMVFFSSVDQNNEIVKMLKKEFRNGIIVPQRKIEDYIEEADTILLGPGMVRTESPLKPTEDYKIKSLRELVDIEDEGIKTYYLTKYFLSKYPKKKWVIDAGALQMINPEWLKQLSGNVIITPHQGEFKGLNSKNIHTPKEFAKTFNCTILLKGEKDMVCSPNKCVEIGGGNAGMTKGGTGDVLAGLAAALATKNELFISALAASYINKKAGESLYKKMGLYFNASDLALEIPVVMKELLLDKTG